MFPESWCNGARILHDIADVRPARLCSCLQWFVYPVFPVSPPRQERNSQRAQACADSGQKRGLYLRYFPAQIMGSPAPSEPVRDALNGRNRKCAFSMQGCAKERRSNSRLIASLPEQRSRGGRATRAKHSGKCVLRRRLLVRAHGMLWPGVRAKGIAGRETARAELQSGPSVLVGDRG